MLLDAMPGLHNEVRLDMGIRIVGTLSAEDQEKAIKLLKDKGALDDSRNLHVRDTLWCGHPKSAIVQLHDGRKEITEVCSMCEKESTASFVFVPTMVRK